MSVIAANCDVPVSVKCRIGVDDRDSYEELCESSLDMFDFLISSFSRLFKYYKETLEFRLCCTGSYTFRLEVKPYWIMYVRKENEQRG